MKEDINVRGGVLWPNELADGVRTRTTEDLYSELKHDKCPTYVQPLIGGIKTI